MLPCGKKLCCRYHSFFFVFFFYKGPLPPQGHLQACSECLPAGLGTWGRCRRKTKQTNTIYKRSWSVLNLKKKQFFHLFLNYFNRMLPEMWYKLQLTGIKINIRPLESASQTRASYMRHLELQVQHQYEALILFYWLASSLGDCCPLSPRQYKPSQKFIKE